MVNVSAYIVPTRNRVRNILNPLKIDRLFYLSILGFIIPLFLKNQKELLKVLTATIQRFKKNRCDNN